MRKLLVAAGVVAGLALTGCKNERQKMEEQGEHLAEEGKEAGRDVASKTTELGRSAKEEVSEAGREPSKTGGGTVTGTLKSTIGGLTIEDHKGAEQKLQTNDETVVRYDGQKANLSDFREGSEIRASYSVQGDEKVAKDVEILKNAYEAEPKQE